MSVTTARRVIRSDPNKIGTGRGVLVLACLSLIAFPPTGIMAVAALNTARRQRTSDPHRARVALDRFRERAWFALGLGAGLYTVLFLIAVFTLNDFALARAFFDVDAMIASAPSIGRGFVLTIQLFVLGEIAILAWALCIAILRSLPGPAAAPVRLLATMYVDLFRGIPALLVIFIVVFGLKRTGIPILSTMDDFWAALLALTLTYGAYVAEVLKAGFESIHWSQTAAARSLGFTYAQSMRYVVLPQALRNMTAPLLNAFISLQKDTSLVAVVGLLDAVNWARIQSLDLASLTPYTVAAFGFLLLTVPLTRLTDRWRKRELARGRAVT